MVTKTPIALITARANIEYSSLCNFLNWHSYSKLYVSLKRIILNDIIDFIIIILSNMYNFISI